MSRDLHFKDDDGNTWSFENLSTQRWLDGHEPGAERVIGYILERAVLLFRAGKLEEAKEMRQLAVEAREAIVPDLQRQVSRHEEEWPSKIAKKSRRSAPSDGTGS